MPNEFCDWVPCDLLQKFIMSLMPGNRTPRTVQALVFHPKNGPKGEPARLVTFYYCPFCGTRIHENKEVLDWIDKRRGRT